jgi:hypothetical protein
VLKFICNTSEEIRVCSSRGWNILQEVDTRDDADKFRKQEHLSDEDKIEIEREHAAEREKSRRTRLE